MRNPKKKLKIEIDFGNKTRHGVMTTTALHAFIAEFNKTRRMKSLKIVKQHGNKKD